MDDSPVWNLFAKDGTSFLVQQYDEVGGQPWKNHQSNVLPEEITPRIDSDFFMRHFKAKGSTV